MTTMFPSQATGDSIPMPQQGHIRNDVLRVEQHLTRIKKQYGEDSAEYQNALRQFARLWSVLTMTRGREEFYEDVVS